MYTSWKRHKAIPDYSLYISVWLKITILQCFLYRDQIQWIWNSKTTAESFYGFDILYSKQEKAQSALQLGSTVILVVYKKYSSKQVGFLTSRRRYDQTSPSQNLGNAIIRTCTEFSRCWYVCCVKQMRLSVSSNAGMGKKSNRMFIGKPET
jgi:hypothetical protein